MTHPYSDWQMAELVRLAHANPERLEGILNSLWAANPGLYEELSAHANSATEPTERPTYALVETGGASCARLSESRIAVWEIIRAYRRAGSIEGLHEEFPQVELGELKAALEYGVENQVEVDLLIARYESMLEQRRAQYPYAR
jgi:uncharacterized protein (DUF433 family)